MKLRNLAYNQLPVFLWAASIFVLSGVQHFPMSHTPLGLDKVAHFVLFFIFCGLAWRALDHQGASQLLKRHALLGAFILAVAYGGLDEVHQVFVPGRSADLYDLAADALGAFGYVAWHRYRSRGAAAAAREV